MSEQSITPLHADQWEGKPCPVIEDKAELGPAQAAADRIEALPQLVPHYLESDDDSCFIRDVLTDLRHFCEREGLDFYRSCDDSYKVYLEERQATP